MRSRYTLLGLAVAFAVCGVVAVLLGLDAVAEMPLGADRITTILGAGLGALALFLTAAVLVAVDVQRRLADRAARSRKALLDAVVTAVEAVRAGQPDESRDDVRGHG